MGNENEECEHKSSIPLFDEEKVQGMSSEQVREKYPRFMGECPECGQSVILYASFMHYIAGDW